MAAQVSELRFSGGTIHLNTPISRKDAMSLPVMKELAALGKTILTLQLNANEGPIARYINDRIQNALDSSGAADFCVKIDECEIQKFFPGLDPVQAFKRFANIANDLVNKVYKSSEGYGWGEAISIKAVVDEPADPCHQGCRVEREKCCEDEKPSIQICCDFESCLTGTDSGALNIPVEVKKDPGCGVDWVTDLQNGNTSSSGGSRATG
jgi:hypothetical protein